MRKREVEGLEEAQAWWGVARGGELHVMPAYGPVLFPDKADARHYARHRDSIVLEKHHVVRVYLVVEDD